MVPSVECCLTASQRVAGRQIEADQRLDAPVHAYIKVTVRELVYTVMKVCAGAVKATQMDEIIKTFKRIILHEGNDMPGYAAIANIHAPNLLITTCIYHPNAGPFSKCQDLTLLP
jgi:hypothetical protein